MAPSFRGTEIAMIMMYLEDEGFHVDVRADAIRLRFLLLCNPAPQFGCGLQSNPLICEAGICNVLTDRTFHVSSDATRCVELMRKPLNRHVNATTPRRSLWSEKKGIELSQLLAAVYTF